MGAGASAVAPDEEGGPCTPPKDEWSMEFILSQQVVMKHMRAYFAESPELRLLNYASEMRRLRGAVGTPGSPVGATDAAQIVGNFFSLAAPQRLPLADDYAEALQAIIAPGQDVACDTFDAPLRSVLEVIETDLWVRFCDNEVALKALLSEKVLRLIGVSFDPATRRLKIG